MDSLTVSILIAYKCTVYQSRAKTHTLTYWTRRQSNSRDPMTQGAGPLLLSPASVITPHGSQFEHGHKQNLIFISNRLSSPITCPCYHKWPQLAIGFISCIPGLTWQEILSSACLWLHFLFVYLAPLPLSPGSFTLWPVLVFWHLGTIWILKPIWSQHESFWRGKLS